MAAKVFIDGEAGTTGLQILDRLQPRNDVALLRLEDHERKDPARRHEMLNSADLVILCLPDDAAREAVSLIENDTTKVIDASTAHRTAPGWVYGMPEYVRNHRETIAAATRVTNPGCYASASVAILNPLVRAGLLPADWPVTINAVSGYSGGGKGLIAAFEDDQSPDYTRAAFRVYGLRLAHKHVPEIQQWSGLTQRPLFVPGVGRFRQGMIVQVPLQLSAIPASPKPADIHAALGKHYAGGAFVTVPDLSVTSEMAVLEPEILNDTNELRLHVFANNEYQQVIVMGVLDNLGKGASGQAVQNMNLMLGLTEDTNL